MYLYLHYDEFNPTLATKHGSLIYLHQELNKKKRSRRRVENACTKFLYKSKISRITINKYEEILPFN
jgi:hypothetical protein